MRIWKTILFVMQLVVFIGHCSEKEFFTCYHHFGCLNFTSEWFHKSHRPRNLQPLERQIINTKFLYLSLSNETNIILFDIITSNPSTFSLTKICKEYSTVFLIHDFTSNGYTGWIKHMALNLFAYKQFNVISVDWQEGAEPPFDQAISNARVVAMEIEKLIISLNCNQKLSFRKTHLIGHGVGAHIAGYVGKSLQKIGRITGLDPTGPRFEGMPPVVHLDCNDAIYVEVLHTDSKGPYRQGTNQQMGNIDFYFNDHLHHQPGCNQSNEHYRIVSLSRKELKEGVIVPDCSHKRAFHYYTEALSQRNCRFIGLPYHNREKYRREDCYVSKDHKISCATIGIFVDIDDYAAQYHAKFLIETEKNSPFCENMYIVTIDFAKCEESEKKSSGYFNILGTDSHAREIVNLTLNYDGSTYPLELVESGKNETFPVDFRYDIGIHQITNIVVKWHYTTPFCYHCKNATCIRSISLEHVTALEDCENGKEKPIIFCASDCEKSKNYMVLYDREPNNNFRKCN